LTAACARGRARVRGTKTRARSADRSAAAPRRSAVPTVRTFETDQDPCFSVSRCWEQRRRSWSQPRTTNHEPRTTNHEPRTTNHEPRTTNHKLLEARHFKHGFGHYRVVFVTAASSHRRVQQLLNDRRDRRRCFVLGECRDDVAHIFREEVRIKARLVGVLQSSLSVNFEDATLCESAEQRFANPRSVHVRLACEREGLGDDNERATNHHLIAEFAELP